MIINTNVSASVTRNYMRVNQQDLQRTMERLSSGKRINSAKDDAAGLAIVSRMYTQTRGLETAIRNAGDGQSLLQTAESAMGSISDILQRMRELAVQADNGTYSDADKDSLQSEVTDLLAEITHISDVTNFNGIQLLDGSIASLDLHISDKFDDTMTITLTDATTTTLAVDGVDIGSTGDAQQAIQDIDAALDAISTDRASLGAKQNRLDFVINNLSVNKQNIESSRSRVEDADMSAEASELAKQQILIQSSIAMLQRANQAPQAVLQLLQG